MAIAQAGECCRRGTCCKLRIAALFTFTQSLTLYLRRSHGTPIRTYRGGGTSSPTSSRC